MATMAQALARAIKRAGPASSQSFSSKAVSKEKQKPVVTFDRGICNDYGAASSREWLVTNAIGGYASGTILGCSTRRYHGLLFAALQPPVGRTQLVAALDETINHAGATYELATHEWVSGAIAPRGF